MSKRQNTVLLFSKLPEVGLVKTRLSILKDGMFLPDTACELYRCMLLDVVEIICATLQDLERDEGEDNTYEFVLSTTPRSNVEAMQVLLDNECFSHEVTVIADDGISFDEHYNHAFSQCWERGADCILSMGADMPALTKADIKFGFKQLHRLFSVEGGGIVLAPDQEMGVSMVGWTRYTKFNHTHVFYHADGLTVLPAYIQKAQEQGLPVLWLPPIPDIDTMADFFHNVTVVHSLVYCAKFDDITPAWRTAKKFTELGFREIRIAPNDLRDPREHIDL